MTKEAALYQFWSSFKLPAYEESSVYSMAGLPTYPYITYEVQTGSFEAVIPLTASLWYRSTNWTDANAKEREIAETIGRGGLTIEIDDGAMHIMRREPFAQKMGDSSDDMIKRIVLNIAVEYWTEN